MEFLNRALAQLSDLFRSMTPGARISSALLLIVVVVGVGYMFAYHGTSPDTYLMNGEQFSAEQLPAMEAAFAKAGLNSYQYEGNRIKVPRGQQSAYVAALADQKALPENYSTILEHALQSTNIFTDPKQRDEAIKAGKQKQLETIIEKMAGVQKAYVQYDSQTNHRIFGAPAVTRASVGVTTSGQQGLTDGTVQAIRALVSGAVAGLAPESVSVTDLRNGRVFTGSGSDASGSVASAVDDPYGSRKRMYEQMWKEKIQEALGYVPGVTVACNVELNPERSHTTESIKYDAKGGTVQMTEKSDTTSSDSAAANGGRPGYSSQQPNAPLALSGSGKGNHEEHEKTENTTLTQPSSTKESSSEAALTPKRVTVSVGVPTSLFAKIWHDRNPTLPGAPVKTPDAAALDQVGTEEISKITELVAKLLPGVEGVNDPKQLVQVTSFDAPPAPVEPLPTFSEHATEWLAEHWSTVGMIFLGLVALLMVRSVVRSIPMAPAAALPAASLAAATAASEPEEEEAPADEATAPRLRRFTGTGRSLRDELTDLVNEDPEAAANVLRTWIGNIATK